VEHAVNRSTIVVVWLVAVLAVAGLSFSRTSLGQSQQQTATQNEEEVTFTEEFLTNPENIALGKEIWHKRCRFCHGAKAYPGKAPKLKPKKYEPEFVYKRITKGFRRMPSWKKRYNQHERMAVVSWVMSKDFEP
jgi:mono/diheme cytochrome c family protein